MRFTFLPLLLLLGFEQSIAQELTIQYASYFGGTGEDYPTQSVIDLAGNVYLVGYTESDDFPTTSGSHQETFGGGSSDGFIMKFNADNTLAWSTYFGGENIDVINDIVILDNMIYLSGYTQSSEDIASGFLESTTLNGISDGLFIAMSTAGEINWSGYIGGNADDFLNGICVDQNGNLYAAGVTQSNSGIATANAYQSNIQGVTDGWVIRITDEGSIVWSTYFGGGGIDRMFDICLNPSGNLTCVGKTNSNDFLITNDGHQQNLAGNSDGLLCIFDPTGQPLYSTYLGGPAQDDLTKVIIYNGIIAAIGNTGSDSGIVTGASPFQSIYGGSLQDGIQLTIDEETSDVYVSYIGGDGFDECLGIYANGDQLWIAMSTSSADLPYDAIFENAGWGMSDAYFISFNPNHERSYSGFIRGVYPDNAKTLIVDDEIRLFGNNYALDDFTTANAYSSVPAGMGDVLFTVLSNPLSISDMPSLQTIQPYPNPCTNFAYIEIPQGDWWIQLSDVHGKLISETVLKNSTRQILNVSNMNSGVYIVRCISDKSVYRGTFIVE